MIDEIKSYTIEELLEEVAKDEDNLSKQVYIDGDTIVIDVEYEYYIELDRCDTYEKILGWVLQLGEKNWMTPSVLRRFITIALSQHGLDYPAI